MLHIIWLICCCVLISLVILSVPTQDNTAMQSISTTSNSGMVSQSRFQPIDLVIWSLTFFFLIMSSIVFFK
uniref:Preprotein translocase subunit SecG n=1 Tax=Rhizochromulina marina TaxID=1034831 RepID=A0A514CPT2_9STRA|nr:preprotein translocase subunit SecG [Rhizochromulina marina]QDH81802.1 preprotein translocase subunit SecG [Rhizochromulina marina]